MSNLVGHNDELDILSNSFRSKNLHSSIIVHGLKGIGKRAFITKFIYNLISLSIGKNSYENQINLFNKNSHPNIKIIEKTIDKKTQKLKNYINIDQIRQLKKFIYESPSVKDLSKIIIIDSADDLNINSANALLKCLEEPSKDTYIFLISHQLSSLLPTIRSRCLKIKLKNHNFENFNKILLNNIDTINDDEIKFLFDLTYGSPGSAIMIFNDNILNVFDITIKSLLSNKINNDILKLSDLLSNLDNDKFKSYLSLLKSILILLSKIQNKENNTKTYLSNKIKNLHESSLNLTKKNIIDRFDFLIKNENELFKYNLDKKLFMLKFLTN